MGTSAMQIFQSASLVRVLKAYDYCIEMILARKEKTTISKDGQRLDRLLMLS